MELNFKNLFPRAQDALKKVTAGMLCLVLVGLCLSVAGCVKQSRCTMKGKFVYYENKEEIYNCGSTRSKANAVFFADGIIREPYYIVNSIPAKFKSKDTLDVMVCLRGIKIVHMFGGCHDTGDGAYKLTCIEED